MMRMIDYSIAIRSAKPGTRKADIDETKAYGVARVSEVMTLDRFARHIADHGSVYTRADVGAILTKMVDCLREMLLEGKKVQLGELGSFGVSLRTRGAKTAGDFTAANIKEARAVWTRGKSFADLASDATFNLVASRDRQAENITDLKGQNGSGLPGLE